MKSTRDYNFTDTRAVNNLRPYGLDGATREYPLIRADGSRSTKSLLNSVKDANLPGFSNLDIGFGEHTVAGEKASIEQYLKLDEVKSVRPQQSVLNFADVRDDAESKLKEFGGILLVQEVGDFPEARRLLKRFATPTAFAVLQQSSAPQVGIEQLNESPSDLTVAYDIPEEATQIGAIHDFASPESWEGQFSHYRKQFTGMNRQGTSRVDLADLPVGTLAELRVRQLVEAQTESSLLLLVGHVENGRVKFHDGSSIGINELNGKGRVWLFGCNTIQSFRHAGGLGLATTRRISYSEAMRMVQIVDNGFHEKLDYRAILTRLDKGHGGVPRSLRRPNIKLLQHRLLTPRYEKTPQPIVTVVSNSRNLVVTHATEQVV